MYSRGGFYAKPTAQKPPPAGFMNTQTQCSVDIKHVLADPWKERASHGKSEREFYFWDQICLTQLLLLSNDTPRDIRGTLVS